MSKYFPGQSNNRRIKPEMLNKIMMDKIEAGLRKLKLKKDSMTITEDNFESAWKMFVYLFSDMRSIWDQSLVLFKEATSTPTSLRRLLLVISNYEPRDYLEVTAKRLFLSIFANDIGFELKNIDEFKLPPPQGKCFLF